MINYIIKLLIRLNGKDITISFDGKYISHIEYYKDSFKINFNDNSILHSDFLTESELVYLIIKLEKEI